MLESASANEDQAPRLPSIRKFVHLISSAGHSVDDQATVEPIISKALTNILDFLSMEVRDSGSPAPTTGFHTRSMYVRPPEYRTPPKKTRSLHLTVTAFNARFSGFGFHVSSLGLRHPAPHGIENR